MNERSILHQSFSVRFAYPVVFTRKVFDPVNRALLEVIQGGGESRQPQRCALFLEAGLAGVMPTLSTAISGYFAAHAGPVQLAAPPFIIPGGESAKDSLDGTLRIADHLADCRLCRHSYAVAVGGGSLLDTVGLATALVHRGLRLIRIPTTVLAQNDAGVGVKNGVNYRGAKNFLGTFAPPFGVVNDFEFIRTLPQPGWADGIAEAFKVAIIKDLGFFDFLCAQAPALAARGERAMEELIHRSARIHLEHIGAGGDPFEFGRSRPLDFGHWSAHQLELMSGYQVSHGQAVGIGILLDSLYAGLLGWLSAAEIARIHQGLAQSGVTLWHDLLERRSADGSLEILDGLRSFQEHLGGVLTITLPRGLGRSVDVHEMDPARVESAISLLKQRSSTANPPC